MNREQLSDAIGRLDEELVGAAMAKRRRPWWVAAVAVAACVALVIGAVTVWPTLTGEENRPPLDVATQPTTVTTDRVDGWPTDATLPEDTTANTTPSDTTAPTTTAKPADKTTTAKHTDKTTAAKPIQKTTQKTTKKTTAPPTATKTPVLTGSKLLAAPKYPELVQRPPMNEKGTGYVGDPTPWKNSVKKQRAEVQGKTDGMTGFYENTIATFLQGEEGRNRVYSPLSTYMALSMLAETTEGDTRDQIADLLGVSKMSTLRDKNAAIWNGVYADDGIVLSRLGSALWLDNGGHGYKTATVDRLAQDYYASVYCGDMDSTAYNKQLQRWLNQQTDGMLKNQVQNVKFPANCVLMLSSTICFKAGWKGKFDEYLTEKESFRTVDGLKDCEFMHGRIKTNAYFGDHYTAVSKELDDGAYKMTFFLPDEDSSVDELIADPQMVALLEGRTDGIRRKHLIVNMSIPKFDVSADYSLDSGLKSLGITDLYDRQKRDMGGIFTNPAMVDGVSTGHAVRVKIDEEGAEGAAFTITKVVIKGTTTPTQKPEEMDFILDRPFVFAITGPGDTILFTGVVEKP